MDELDQERSTAQALAAAGAAAALFAGLALVITRKRGESEPAVVGVGAKALERIKGDEVGHLADQVASLAPEVLDVLDVLEQHAPDSLRRLRDRLPSLGRTRQDLAAATSTAAERHSDRADQAGQRIEETVDAAKRGGDRAEIDFSMLSPAQATAARAAAAAVARAERALGAVGAAGSRSRETGHGAADDFALTARDVAQQAAEVALDLWHQARGRVATAGDGELAGETAAHLKSTLVEGAHEAGEKTRGAVAEATARVQGIAHGVADRIHHAEGREPDLGDKTHHVGDKAHDLGDRAKQGAHDLGEKARQGVRDAAGTTVDTGRETVSAFAWLVAAIAVVVYVLLKPERRESLTRFADEAVIQVQELLRDLRGYDDEF